MNRLKLEIAEYVGNYTRKRGFPPTVEELVRVFGFTTVVALTFYIMNLYKIGMIRNSLFYGTGNLQLLPMKTN